MTFPNGNCGAAILAAFFIKQAGSLHHKGVWGGEKPLDIILSWKPRFP
jgi:hypothetical protein